MKKLLFFALVIFVSSCSTGDKDPKSAEEIATKISEYRKEVADINRKINELEKSLSSMEYGTNPGIPVKVLKLKYQTFDHFIEINGTVEAVNAAFISPEINGQVKEILVKEGQRVSKGDVLLKINNSITDNTIKEVETALELATTVYEKQKQLWDKNIGSELDYLSAKNNKESLEGKLETLKSQATMANITAPIDGIVDEILLKEGELAIPGMMAIQLINLDQLYINADVSEAYITKVKKGDMVNVEFPSYPGISVKAPVYRTGNSVKPANRTFVVQVKVENRSGVIKPNVLAKVKINDYTADNALLVPDLIIKQDLKGSYVYKVLPGNNSASKVYVTIGKSYQGYSMVTSGLSENDLVIVEGYNQTSDGAKVTVI
ncbi:MAG: efflux RND transporter periplasmic adaptor subunit [Bacteroidales bacterium]|nr:efflux RND transporter periplasmic adaptor subunit [Bacteroidales bacterium]MCF8403623.1 efflux RND transporter periplasmic adaptor subunit [Bacteroidales bacterium]